MGANREWGEICRIVLLSGSLAVMSARAFAQEQTGSQPGQPAAPPSQPTTQPVPQPDSQPSPQTEPGEPSKKEPSQNEPANTEPQKSQSQDEKNNDNANPVQGMANKTVDVTTQVAEATKQLGNQALNKARDWESGWLTGVYVEKGRPLVAVTEQQRRQIYLEQTLTKPGAYMKRMFAAGIDQARGAPQQWDDGWGGYGERFASREGQFIAANSLAALGNAKLKYEPRYDQCRCEGFWPRTRHAILRNFLTYNESEQELRPQWGLYGGSFGGGLISTSWKPHPRNGFAEGGRAMLGQAGYGSLLNFFIEFSTDINRKIGARKK
ncbi:MAG TPA: hypothetical protein VGM18_13675 [Candidatus Sulfotelmatobacter sp.]